MFSSSSRRYHHKKIGHGARGLVEKVLVLTLHYSCSEELFTRFVLNRIYYFVADFTSTWRVSFVVRYVLPFAPNTVTPILQLSYCSYNYNSDANTFLPHYIRELIKASCKEYRDGPLISPDFCLIVSRRCKFITFDFALCQMLFPRYRECRD